MFHKAIRSTKSASKNERELRTMTHKDDNCPYLAMTPMEALIVLAICCAMSFGIGMIVEMLRVAL